MSDESSASLAGAGESELRRSLTELLSIPTPPLFPFPTKWRLIQSTLHHLHTLLLSTTFISTPLLLSLSTTLSSILDLLTHHQPISSGKLLLQSDLHLALSNLQLHLHQISTLPSSSDSTSNSIVLSRPRKDCGLEDFRFYVKDLLSKFRIGGGLEVKLGALLDLVEVLRDGDDDDDRLRRVVVEEFGEVLSFLVSFLQFEDFRIIEKAAEAVLVLAGVGFGRVALVFAGAVPALVGVLERGSELGKELAVKAVKRLTEYGDNAWSVSASGGVSVLLDLCGVLDDDDSYGNSGELVVCACGVLRNLVGVAEIRSFVVDSGGVLVFLDMVRSKEDSFWIPAMEVLQTMVSDDEKVKELVLREGGIYPFLQILDFKYSSKAREVAIRLIESLCFASANSISLLLGLGFLERVIGLLKNSDEILALRASCRLCEVSEEARKAMGELRFMPELVSLLESNSTEIRELAAKALSLIVPVQKNRRRFIQEEQNVSKILQALNQVDDKSLTKKFLLSSLVSLSGSNSGRRKIVASGHVKNLEKLAETDVVDAKRIVKKINGSRFRSILHGMWSL